jgi:hypothetical protein
MRRSNKLMRIDGKRLKKIHKIKQRSNRQTRREIQNPLPPGKLGNRKIALRVYLVRWRTIPQHLRNRSFQMKP